MDPTIAMIIGVIIGFVLGVAAIGAFVLVAAVRTLRHPTSPKTTNTQDTHAIIDSKDK